MYYQEETDKRERRKIIAVATVAVVVILILIVAIIVVATNKSSKPVSEGENAPFEVTENSSNVDTNKGENKEAETTTTENKPENDSKDKVGNLSTKTTDANKKVTETNNAPAKSEPMPDTGPEDFLPIALLLGSLTTYIGSAVLAKRQA